MRRFITYISSSDRLLYTLFVAQWLTYWLIAIWAPSAVEAVVYQRF